MCRTPRATDSRTAFVRALVAAVSFPVLALAALQVYYDTTVSKKDRYLPAVLAGGDASTRVIILGDSHPASALPPSALPPGFHTAASSGDSVREAYLKLRALLDRLPAVDTVVVQCDPHVLSSYRLAANNRFLTYYFARPRDIKAVYGRGPGALRRAAVTAVPVLDLNNRVETIAILKEHARTLRGRARGGAPAPPWYMLPAEQRRAAALSRARQQFRDGRLEGDLLDVVGRIVETARARGVRVVGVTYPVSPEYVEAMSSTGIESLRRAFAAVPFDLRLDYQAVFADRPELFFDEDHLNRAGAGEFAALLLRDLESRRSTR
jgi:hypothetical protein